MTTHTPGPWRWENAHGGDPRLIDQTGNEVLDGWDGAGVHVNKADARLIATAPDLLAALKAITFNVDPAPNDAKLTKLWNMALTAIAKAEGK